MFPWRYMEVHLFSFLFLLPQAPTLSRANSRPAPLSSDPIAVLVLERQLTAPSKGLRLARCTALHRVQQPLMVLYPAVLFPAAQTWATFPSFPPPFDNVHLSPRPASRVLFIIFGRFPFLGHFTLFAGLSWRVDDGLGIFLCDVGDIFFLFLATLVGLVQTKRFHSKLSKFNKLF